MLTLVIGNKNYSSWSMRPWVLLRAFDIPFCEVMLKFHTPDWDKNIAHFSPTKMVPVLWDGEVGHPHSTCVWESNAIYEYIAEVVPEVGIWPVDSAARAHGRAIAAEMHAGFRPLRVAMPMNIRARFPGLGMNEEVAKNIARIEFMWRDTRARFGADGPFLFGAFSAADAMYAPVVMRFMTYSPTLAADTEAYCAAMRAHPAIAAWMADAMNEPDVVAEDEPYAATVKK
jgi:glutathione S-transferase